MDVQGRDIAILGGTGLVGRAVARRVLERGPSRLVVAGLREEEVETTVDELRREPAAGGVELVPEHGDLFLREEHEGLSRSELLDSPRGRQQVLEDVFGPLDEDAYGRSALTGLLERRRPDVLVDCVNTATAIAYQDVFTSAERLRAELEGDGGLSRESVETHLSSLYLPQLIRHIQLLLEGMKRTGTEMYLKIGTSGTGGMGLNIPFTHSEERPSPTLLAKASVAGAHSLLLFLMARTPGAPAVKEIKPAAAVAWKRIGYGTVERADGPIRRVDAVRSVPVETALGGDAGDAWEDTGEPLESVFLDAGENGLFSRGEFESISTLDMMEIVTPEEIADTVLAEIEGRPTGREVVSALDGAAFGPTYRGGVLREAALRRMEELEERHGVRSVAFEMLGPPRLSKLLFEGAILERLYPDLEAAADLEPEATARRAAELLEDDRRLRSDIVSIGIPVLLPDGERMLRGPEVKVTPEPGEMEDRGRWAARGWVDLRPASWRRWADRCRGYLEEQVRAPGPDEGSVTDLDVRGRSGEIRPGALAGYVFRIEDEGERIKR
jgi:NAD(P)-dependent dehydrogenase (short-subunit alcohol dehydrogenase family)